MGLSTLGVKPLMLVIYALELVMLNWEGISFTHKVE
jgi:hypothetical protein